LRALREVWRRGVPFVPRLGQGDDDQTALLNSLALDASARRIGIRRVLGPSTLVNLLTYLGTQAFFRGTGSDWASWYQRVLRRAAGLFRALGDPAWDAATNAVRWDPRIADAVLADRAAVFAQPLVAPETLSATAGLPLQ